MAGGTGGQPPWRMSDGSWRYLASSAAEAAGASSASAGPSSRHDTRGVGSGQRRAESRRQLAQEKRAQASIEEMTRKAEEHKQAMASMQLNTMLSESLASTERAVAEDAWEEVASEKRVVESLEMAELTHQAEVEEAEHSYNQEEATVQKLQMQLDELRAKRQRFESMSSKAAREAQDLRRQILLEQAAVEVKREMIVGNIVDSIESATMPAAEVTSETKTQVVQIKEAKPDIAAPEWHTPEYMDDEDDAAASDPLFKAIESAKDDSPA